jgi:hypothetical protein
MTTHQLKTDPAPFHETVNGRKTFEIRYNDRDYKTGDALILRETKYSGAEMKEGAPLEYTGRECVAYVTYTMEDMYGLSQRWMIMGHTIPSEVRR